ERLLDAGEVEYTRGCHLRHFLAFTEQAEPKLRGPEARVFIERLEEEHDNLRLALEWSLHADGDVALRLSGALAWFWYARAYHSEGRRWLARTLASSVQRSPARAKALHGAGWLAHHQRDSDAARELLGESLAIAREVDDCWMVASASHAL